MTYLTNLMDAIKGIPPAPPKEVIKKDPRGLIKADLALIRRFMDSKPYTVGDSLDLVAYKAGQKKLYDMIETKIVARPADSTIGVV